MIFHGDVRKSRSEYLLFLMKPSFDRATLIRQGIRAIADEA